MSRETRPASLCFPYGDVAQLVERLLCKQEVVGSIPIVSTTVSTLNPTVRSTAVLLISCPDRPGIVADVAGWITAVGGNIEDAEQHRDDQDAMFFQRVVFTHDAAQTVSDLSGAFAPVASKHHMAYELHALPWRPRTAILVSKTVHCLSDLLTRSRYADLGLDIRAVVSNHDDSRGLVEAFGYDYHHVPVVGDGRAEQEQHVSSLLDSLDLDLVVLARYMLVLPPWFADKWRGRMINIHHSFLPAFIGANPYRQAHDRGVKIIGATAHYVTSDLDEGPIIEQDVARVTHRDDVPELTRRGRDLETVVLARAVRAHVERRVLVFNNRTVVFG
ncbi:MAG: Formyltetrahydrofolate deformylase [Actinomycetota bacterium]